MNLEYKTYLTHIHPILDRTWEASHFEALYLRKVIPGHFIDSIQNNS